MALLVSCNSGSVNTTSIIGEWVEYRADAPRDTYLLGHLKFNPDGTGKFWLTDVGKTRASFAFSWEKGGGSIITYTTNDATEYDYNNGLIVEHSALGEIVYKKK